MAFQDGIVGQKALATGIAEEASDTIESFPIEHEVGNVSMRYGFPSSYDCPIANKGNTVGRTQVNGILYQATANESRRQQGTINTYDAEVAAKSGGYSKGAVLDWWNSEDEIVRRVISLVDENTTDFTDDGPDGVHWRLCSDDMSWMPNLATSGMRIVASFDSLYLSSSYSYATGEYVMPFDGYITCYTNLTSTPPVASVPYCTYLARTSGVEDPEVSGYTLITPAEYARSENVKLAAYTAFSECGHKLYMAVGNDISGVSLSDDTAVTSTGCGVFMVSSSGLDGNAAQLMIPVKKWCKLRLFGKQTYTDEHIVSYAQYKGDRTDTFINGFRIPDGGALTHTKEYAAGTFHLSCVITAVPMGGE